MKHYSCQNCVYRDGNVCLYYSKKVKVFTSNGEEVRGTILLVEKDWRCRKFKEAISAYNVAEMERDKDKDF